MKKLDIKINPKIGFGLALGILGVAQAIITGKKEESEKEQLKAEIKSEILNDLSEPENE